jgi:hypothetical protein
MLSEIYHKKNGLSTTFLKKLATNRECARYHNHIVSYSFLPWPACCVVLISQEKFDAYISLLSNQGFAVICCVFLYGLPVPLPKILSQMHAGISLDGGDFVLNCQNKDA